MSASRSPNPPALTPNRPPRPTPARLVATLGSEAQVVTAAVDLLERQGTPLTQVIVVHSLAEPGAPMAAAVERLQRAFDLPPYLNRLPLRLAPLIDSAGRPLQDVDTPLAARAAFRLIYRLVRQAKLEGERVHLSIAGGRKSLALFGMSTAQLLFDEEDHLWHLISSGDFLASKRLHPQPEDEVQLLELPVLPWSQAAPALLALSTLEDPFEAAEHARQRHLDQRLEHERAFVLGALTPAEQRVVSLLVSDGLGDAEIANRLALSPRTVEQHLRSAYRKAANHWELPDVNRAQLVALLSLYVQITGFPA